MTTGRDDRDFLELLRANYDYLHKSVWEAHKISWIMTGIFVPIVFGAIGFFFRERDLGPLTTAAGAAVISTVIWFWYFMLRILAGYNKARFSHLRELEGALNSYYLSRRSGGEVRFKQYTLQKRKRWLKFGRLNLYFAVIMTILLFVIALSRSADL